MSSTLARFSRRRHAAIWNRLLISSLLAATLLIPVNEAVRAEIIEQETFELTISENEPRAIRYWETPTVDFPGGFGTTPEDQSLGCLRPGTPETPVRPGTQATQCFDYKLNVSYPDDIGRARLRVALKSVNVIGGRALTADDLWAVALIHPDAAEELRPVTDPLPVGREVTGPLGVHRSGQQDPTTSALGAETRSQFDTVEIFADLGPSALDAGVWTVRVMATGVNGGCDNDPTRPGCGPGSARLRAILETEPHPNLPDAPLFPDLEAIPPLALNFRGDEIRPGANLVAGDANTAPNGCIAADSRSSEGTFPEACLRMGWGDQNVGDGPLELRLNFNREKSNIAEGELVADVVQHVFLEDATPWDYSDNLSEEFPAGEATYHPSHGHWHYDGIWEGRLFTVNPGGRLNLKKSLVSDKLGSCAHDGLLAEFDETFQDTQGTNDSGTDCQSAVAPGHTTPAGAENRIALSRGWADLYPQGTSDQYFGFSEDFTKKGEGTYLAQIQVDPDDRIRERNEDNNFAYVLFTISGYTKGTPRSATIEVLERGRGKSHLDPNKVVVFGVAE